MKKIGDVMELEGTYLKKLPVNKRISLLSEIQNLRKHVEKRCASSTETGGGTENHERCIYTCI